MPRTITITSRRSPLQWLEFRNYNCRNRNRPWHRRPCLSAKVLARGKRQSVLVADHKASVEFFNRPRWWEAAGGSMTVPY